MKKAIRLIFVVLTLHSFCFAGTEVAYDRQISLVREINNFHVVTPSIMRGSQPSEEGLRLLKNYCGVKTILSLNNDRQHNRWEKSITAKLDMNFINIPMEGNKEQSIETIERCLEIIHDSANQPIFVHCQAGKDRTGLIFAAYRIKYDHWSLKDVLMEMLVYGYDRGCCENLEKSLMKWINWREGHHE